VEKLHPANMTSDVRRLGLTNPGQPEVAADDFHDVNLSGVDLTETKVRNANFRSSKLVGANLAKADLELSDFEGADLMGADLHEATLRGASLKGTVLKNAKLHNSDLECADLTGATGLLPGQLAGANLSGAKIPENIAFGNALDVVKELSDTAAKILVSVTTACLYCWLTIATTDDAKLLPNSASSTLPILQTAIPIVGFYIIAPLMLLGLFFYYQIALQRVWESMASLPAVFPDGVTLDRKATSFVLIGFARYHRHLKTNLAPLHRIHTVVFLILNWWLVPFTLLLFWWRYLYRHELSVTVPHLTLLCFSLGAALLLYLLAVATLRGKVGKDHPDGAMSALRLWKTALGMLCVGVLIGVLTWTSWKVVAGTSTWFNFDAQLYNADVSTKPPNWTGKPDEIAQVKGARLVHSNLHGAFAIRAFLVKANLAVADLSNAALSDADLRGAALWNSNLRRTSLERANLTDADLLSADLTKAFLESADLRRADLSHSNLTDAILQGADLRGANLEDAILKNADLDLANLADVRGLSLMNLKTSRNWQTAVYSDEMLDKLGLTSEENAKRLKAFEDQARQPYRMEEW
jgi:uncharacterized protein YjbI with pentapeptide repeats